jgi:hypothetical protein
MESTKYIDRTKYIGMDVHKETVSIAVMNSTGKLVMESIIETKTATILQFISKRNGIRRKGPTKRKRTALRAIGCA